MTRAIRFALATTLFLSFAGLASAQRGPAAEGGRNQAGVFDYYALVLSWSPTYCAGLPRGKTDPQCSPRGRPYAFVLHGLWPQYERGFPGNCPVRDSFVPRPVINGMLDIMPSPSLVIHEYRKHGTCSGLTPQGYYELSRKLFTAVKVPPRFVEPAAPMFVSPAEVVRDFTTANPGLKPDMIAVVCGGPGNRLREVRICHGKDGQPRTCGSNEQQRRLCSADRMYVPPVRAGAGQNG